MKKLNVGDKVWLTGTNGENGREAVVSKVGRTIADLESQSCWPVRFYIETGESHPNTRGYFLVFESREAAEAEFAERRAGQDRDKAWLELVRILPGWHAPQHLTTADVLAIRAKIFPEVAK